MKLFITVYSRNVHSFFVEDFQSDALYWFQLYTMQSQIRWFSMERIHLSFIENLFEDLVLRGGGPLHSILPKSQFLVKSEDFCLLGSIWPMGRWGHTLGEHWLEPPPPPLPRLFSFFIITFDWNGNFEFLWFHQKNLSSSDLSEYTLFQNK